MQNIIFLLGIVISVVESKGNNWSQQGGNRWQNSDNPSSQSVNQGNVVQSQVGSGSGNAGKSNYGQGGRGWTSRDMQVKDDGSWNNMRNAQNGGSWGPQDTQVKDTGKIGGSNQEGPNSQGWTAGDSQTKDTDKKNYGRNNQDTRRMWNPEDAQIKDAGSWNSGGNQQTNRNNWGPQDSQIKDGSGNQQNRNNWGPSDAQVKDSGRRNGGPNQGNFDPSDSQMKDSGSWNAGGNYPSAGNFGPNDAQVKDSNRWKGTGSQQPSGPFGPGDAQEKSPGSWMGDGNQKMSGGWNPADGQVKDNDGWKRDGNNQGGGSRWGPDEGQMKINEGFDQGDKKDSTPGMWDRGQGPVEGGPAGGKWQPDQGPGPEQGGEWPSSQDGMNKPPVDQGPTIDGNQGIDDNLGGVQPGDVGIPEDGYGPGGNREMGDTGMVPDAFPPRVPQGNYKGGDTPHPGDDSSQWRLEDSIPGTPGVDYPNYSTIPETGFDCKQHPDPGYYGDVEAQCQVFHICQADGRHDSFLCPLGTIFNQQYFVCVWWFNYDCADTTMYYNLNADLYKGGHGAQGNFKGTPVGTTGPSDSSDNYSTPSTITTGGLGDTGRSDYGSGPTSGQVDSIIPPGVGVQNVAQTGMIGPIPPSGTGAQPGSWGANQGPGMVSVEQPGYGPTTEQPVSVPQGVWSGGDGPKSQDGAGRGPDSPAVTGGQNNGYGPGRDNRGQDGGKRNWGNQSGQRDWGVKGGSANGNQGGRWGSGEDSTRSNWGNGDGYDGGKKGGNWGPNGGSVKGRKARSWGSGEIYDSGVDKRWGSEESEVPFDGQQGSWMSLDEVSPPAPFANHETHARSEVYEEEKAQNGNWNAGSVEQGQRGFASDPQQFPRIPDWDDKEKDLGSSEHNRNWSNGERNNDLEAIGDRPIDQGRKWRTIDDSRERINNEDERPQTINKNWWRDTLVRNEEDNKENWNEGESEPSLRLNNVQDTKDTPHIYGNWRSLNNYFDHDKDYNSENNSEQQNWTK
ncbi:chitin-binding type-2 domain-containing protein [Nephila pilipes]|uniref:Chitin-binding type-2 domain-containing protein n=1 Tax=Nephila pilipes TaxID=299642 RepID=A0A8X6MYV0_NEPPI|nr:chitin-binding type-2 domain-containing protein [Nephila pilipes]